MRFKKHLPIILFLLIAGVVAVSILIPAINQYRTPMGPRCSSNLHQIGLAIAAYCADHNGGYPDSFQTILLKTEIAPSVLICPSSNDEATTAPTTQAQIADLTHAGHLSYIYLGKGLTDKTVLAKQVIVYEPLSNHRDGINVLLGDGHTEFADVKRATKIISDANAGIRPVILPP